jgi:hypothetical protein
LGKSLTVFEESPRLKLLCKLLLKMFNFNVLILKENKKTALVAVNVKVEGKGIRVPEF